MVGRLSGLFSKHASNVQQRSAYGFTFHVALVAGSVDYLMDAVGTLSGTRGSTCFNSWHRGSLAARGDFLEARSMSFDVERELYSSTKEIGHDGC